MIKEKCLTYREMYLLNRKVKKTIGFKTLSYKIDMKYFTLKARFNGYLKLPESLAKKINEIIEESEQKNELFDILIE